MASCEVTAEGKPSVVATAPARSPYEAKFVDFENDFRFALYLSAQQDLLKTSTYYKSKKRYVLLQQNTLRLTPGQCALAPMTSHVYSPELERELSYTCQLACDKK